MKQRLVVIPIDDLLNMMRDYMSSAEIPEDAQPLKLMRNSQEQNKIGILVESPSSAFEGEERQTQLVHFDLRRLYKVS